MSKIASSGRTHFFSHSDEPIYLRLIIDYPEEWPSLLPDLLGLINGGNNNEAHGALRVLSG